MTSPILEFNYDISCPFAYIASTRIEALAARTNATLIWRPVLLGAIYRATSAPQGAAGSASDVFNAAKKAVTSRSMQRTLTRHNIQYNPPARHPRKTVNALRLLYCVQGEERRRLSKALFRAYWVEGRDVSDEDVLMRVVGESGVRGLGRDAWRDGAARRELEVATGEAIERGAFGVPGFWVPGEKWVDLGDEARVGRYYWGQDRMHFVEASLLALGRGVGWEGVEGLKGLVPRVVKGNRSEGKVRVEFWFDFSSPWAFLGWTQLERLKRQFEGVEVVLKPFLLGILFREIGAPNLPMSAVSPAKALWSRQDHSDWVRYWNAVNVQEGSPDRNIDFDWAEIFPIRTPTVLRCAIADPSTIPLLYRACWERNLNVSDDSVLQSILDDAGYNSVELLAKANSPDIKNELRKLTAEAKDIGLCGVPSYRVFRQEQGKWKNVGGIVWGQDELNVVEDLIAGWDGETRPTDEIEKAKL